ncbi:unnamed protein product, partial [marine sediment metagenome]
TTHSIGTYNYYCNISETENYLFAENSSIMNINKAESILSLTATPAWTNGYGTQTTVSCVADHAEATPTLYLEGVPVSNPYTTTHPSGSYNYSCNISETSNHNSAEDSDIVNINKAIPVITLTASPHWQITHNAQATITCSVDNSQTTISLYRDDILVDSSLGGTVTDSDTFPSGNYVYICNSSETQNYISASKTNTLVAGERQGTTLTLTASPAWTNDYGTQT